MNEYLYQAEPVATEKRIYWIIGGIVLIVATALAFIYTTLSNKPNVTLSITSDGQTTEASVFSPDDRLQLVWETSDVQNCRLSADNSPRAIEVAASQNGGRASNVLQDFLHQLEFGIQWDMRSLGLSVPALPKPRMFTPVVQPGEQVTYTLTCDDTSDAVTIRMRNYRLTDFELAANRWRPRFDTTSIPTNEYRAFYFDKTNPNNVIYSETVPNVAIEYFRFSDQDFSIEPKQFGGYWIGAIDIKKEGTYSLTTTVGRSEARVIVNGRELITGDQTRDIYLTPGRYEVEVEYLNDWHTVDFMMIFTPKQKIYSLDEVKSILDNQEPLDAWYVYGYNENPVLTVSSATKRKTVLLLESYEPNQWVIENAIKGNIEYILYHSHEDGSTVSSDLSNQNILQVEEGVIPKPDGYGSSDISARCWTDDYPPRCDNVYTVSNLSTFTQEIFGGNLTGFTRLNDSDERTETLTIPRTPLNQDIIIQIQRENDQIKSDAERQAKIKAGSSIEQLFTQ